MPRKPRIKRRGFVMTGGGAKGLYEAGVIHAFHLTGMEFDVITGSSIGAMNSLFYAEYLYCKRQLPPEIQKDALQVIDRMDGLVKAYHHAWLSMPEKRVVDDSAEGPLGKLKDDLLRFNLSLPQLTALGWWLVDPDRHAVPPPALWPKVLSLLRELAERLGPSELLDLLKNHRSDFLRQALRTYLGRFALESSLVPPADDNKLKDIFTLPISPLRPEHLAAEGALPDPPNTERYALVNPARSMSEYAAQGIELRLTRANYRTGRLEISAYVSARQFAYFLDKYAWRIRAVPPEQIPLGSFRLVVPGDPIAINAALCSGRFPGVFRPYKLEDIYPHSGPENELLYRLVQGWLADPEVKSALEPEFAALSPGGIGNKYADWQSSGEMRQFFPLSGDTYVDGGAIDNTPYNAAVDYIRRDLNLRGASRLDERLELFVIYLSTEPRVPPDKAQDPAIFEVVGRTLAIQSAAREASRADTLETLNTFGRRAENIGQLLTLVLDSYMETLDGLDPAIRHQVEHDLRARAQALGHRGVIGQQSAGILERMADWTSTSLAEDLPLQVEAVKIYPAEMPLDTLQFTPRLGYRRENALRMLSSGCYDTLNAIRTRLESGERGDLDEMDHRALTLARRWMGEGPWPPEGMPPDRASFNPPWPCQRSECVFHADICRHGLAGDLRSPKRTESSMASTANNL
jgi:hypothetical protein